MNGISTARSLLFVPANRPDRFAKAAAAGADLVVVDLEDAVPAAEKDTAREHLSRAVADGARPVVRVNGVGTPWHDEDLALARRHDLAIMLPKADVAAVAGLDDLSVVALVETARGLLDAPTLAADAAIDRLALGHLDLAAELAVSPDSRAVVDHARLTLVVASAAAGLLGPIDAVTPHVHDPDRLAADLDSAVALGCAGKLCLHPAQVFATHAALTPAPDEVERARRVVAAHSTSPRPGVFLLDGQLVDAPVVARARRLLSRIHALPDEGEHP